MNSKYFPLFPLFLVLSVLGIFAYKIHDNQVKSEAERKLREEPQFRQGDCVQFKRDPDEEDWELSKATTTYQITKVGKKKYRVSFSVGYGEYANSEIAYFRQEYYEKVDCNLY